MQNVDRDIIVIGAGGCGLLAALVAAKRARGCCCSRKRISLAAGQLFLPRAFAPPEADGSAS